MYQRAKRTWIIFDTHFCHMNLCKYCNRPSNFNQLIIEHWRKMIASDDLVFHGGDVYFGRKNEFFDCVRDLPGQKILIRGNHDKEKLNWYLNHGFTAVLDFAAVIVKMKESNHQFSYQRVILSHRPIDIPKLGGYSKTINIFGHFHNNPLEKCEKKLVDKLTKNHYLFSLERTNYKPVLLCNAVADGWVQTLVSEQKLRG